MQISVLIPAQYQDQLEGKHSRTQVLLLIFWPGPDPLCCPPATAGADTGGGGGDGLWPEVLAGVAVHVIDLVPAPCIASQHHSASNPKRCSVLAQRMQAPLAPSSIAVPHRRVHRAGGCCAYAEFV